MKVFNRILNYVRYAKTSKLVMAAVFTLALAGTVAGLVVSSQSGANAASCDIVAHSNDIIRCGVTTPSDFATKVKQNSTGDLQNIYTHYGLPMSQLDNFAKNAKAGVAYKDGTIKVDGKTVATNAHSLGRNQKNGDWGISIAGRTYYQGYNTTAFASNSLPALVLLDSTGKFVFAVLNACGNPTVGKPTPPVYSCNMMSATQISRTQYNFSTQAAATNGASISKYVYDFGDGTTATGGANISHTYAKEGKYTVKVTVYVTVNGQSVPVTAANCSKPIEVKPEEQKPVYSCTALTAHLIGKQEDRTYGYSLTYTAAGGATLRDADYDFGDGQTVKGVKPADLSKVTHQFAKEGDYTTKATLHFTVGNAVKDVSCETKISVSPEACPTNPSLPKGSPDCAPCEIPGKEQFPKNSPECQTAVTPPTELPSTGPADFIGGALGVSSVTGAGYYWLRSRKDLISKLLNR